MQITTVKSQARLAAAALAAVAGLAAAGNASAADIIYAQDFDAAGAAARAAIDAGKANGNAAAPAGWQVMANGAVVTDKLLVGGDASVWGGSASGYYAAAVGSNDYSLGFYASNNTAIYEMACTFTADRTTSDIGGSFDFEVPWSRENGSKARVGQFDYGVRYSVNDNLFNSPTRGYDMPFAGVKPSVSNALVTSETQARWLSDAEMDGLGLSRRNVSFSLPDSVVLEPGDTLTLLFSSDYSGPSTSKGMLNSVDNFRLTAVVPEPATLALAGCAGLTLLRRRRA